MTNLKALYESSALSASDYLKIVSARLGFKRKESPDHWSKKNQYKSKIKELENELFKKVKIKKIKKLVNDNSRIEHELIHWYDNCK